MFKKLTAIVMTLILVAAIIFFGFKGSSGKSNQKINLVDVKRDNIIDKAIAIGEIKPDKEIEVKSHIAGVVSKMFVEENNLVKVGDPLFEISPRPTPDQMVNAELALDQAEIVSRNCESAYERKQELFNKSLLSKSEFDDAQRDVEVARLDVQRAQENLSLLKDGKTKLTSGTIESVIRAPVSGTVLAINREEGDPVEPMSSYQPGTSVVSLANMSDLVFRGTVDEIDVGKLHEGMNVTLKVGALSSDTVEGRLYRIASKARKQDQTTVFDVEIEITKASLNVLRAGYSATAEIIINQKQNVLVIPERLVTFRADSSFVDVQDSLGKITTVPVKTGLSDGINIEIDSGLQEKQKIVEYPPKEIQ